MSEGGWCDVVCPPKTKPNDVGMNRGTENQRKEKVEREFQRSTAQNAGQWGERGNARTEEAVGSSFSWFCFCFCFPLSFTLLFFYLVLLLSLLSCGTTGLRPPLFFFFSSWAELHEEMEKERKRHDTTWQDMPSFLCV